MKKLVTIVSAVMMLLMLAACAPTLTIDADQAAALEKAKMAMSLVGDYMTQEKVTESNGTKSFEVKENTEIKNTTAEDIEGAVILAGSTYSISTKDGKTEQSINVKLSWVAVDGTTKTNVEASVEYASTTTKNTETGATTVQMGPFKIDGVAYEPALFSLAN